MPLLECFTKHLNAALEKRERHCAEHARLLQRRAELKAFASEAIAFVETAAGNVRWEKSNWDGLLHVLQAGVEEFGRERVGAALVFCRLELSNSVAAEIKRRFGAPEL